MIFLIICYAVITYAVGKIIYEMEVPDISAWIGAMMITTPVFFLIYLGLAI